MYINQGANEYHHLQIKYITDRSMEIIKPWVKLECVGKYMHYTSETKSGYKIYSYQIFVYAIGRMMDYVLAELQPKDMIFVVGRSIDRRPNKYNKTRGLLAECIYREDWMKFYGKGSGGSLNPQDFSFSIDDIKEEDL